MSKIPERLMFLHPSLYSSDKFRVRQVILKPANPPSSKNYFGQGDSIVYNIGGNPNQFIVPESAYLCFGLRVCPTDVLGLGTQDPYALNSGGWDERSAYGVPRPDFGLPFFDQINCTLDSSRNIVNVSGAALCRSYLNGRLACSSTSSTPDLFDYEADDPAMAPVDRTNTTGPVSLCGFSSNSTRVNAYCGPYRNSVDSATKLEQVGIKNGALNYKVPLSLFTGLLDAYASSYLPIGMLAQSSASGLTLQLRLAKKEDVLVDSGVSVPFLSHRCMKKNYYTILPADNSYSNDGTLRHTAYTGGDGNDGPKYFPIVDGAATTDAVRANLLLLETMLSSRSVYQPYRDGVGNNLANCFYAVLEPYLIYKVVEVLDENILNLMRASFNGQNVENVSIGEQVFSVPKLLNIKYRAFTCNQRQIPAGMSSVSFTISTTEPSLRGIMVRFQAQELDGTSKPTTKSADSELTVFKYQVKVGSAVYPLTQIQSVNSANFPAIEAGDVADSSAVASYANGLLKTFAGDSYAQLAGLQEDSRSMFSPWFDVDSSENMEDIAFRSILSVGMGNAQANKGLSQQIRPLLISFDNHTTYEHERFDNSATGIDMRGIGSYTLELEVREVSQRTASAPTKAYNVFIVDCYDSVLSVKRNSVDPTYEFAIY